MKEELSLFFLDNVNGGNQILKEGIIYSSYIIFLYISLLSYGWAITASTDTSKIKVGSILALTSIAIPIAMDGMLRSLKNIEREASKVKQ